jgi:hypothetical protein
MKAIHDFKSKDGHERKAGQSYVIKNPLFYLCDVNEMIVQVNDPIILNDKKSIMISAEKNLTDIFNK